MRLKRRFQSALTGGREFSEALLAGFKTPEQWTYQVHPKANHAVWFAGHIGVIENFMISLLAPEKGDEKAGYPETFGLGSMPIGDPAKYPPVEEVLAYMRERREVLLGVLDGLSDEDFDTPTPDEAPKFLPTYGSIFQLAAIHEAFHIGQVSVAARALGMPPRI